MRNLKRLIFFAAICAAASATINAAKPTEVAIVKQLTWAERKTLPTETRQIEIKRLVTATNADTMFLSAFVSMLDSVVQLDGVHRVFEVLIEPADDSGLKLTICDADITQNVQDKSSRYYGDWEYDRYHFAVINNPLVERLLRSTFKQQGKVKFVREYEFVNFPTPSTPTYIVAYWHADYGLSCDPPPMTIHK